MVVFIQRNEFWNTFFSYSYRSQALRDSESVYRRVQQLLQQLNQSADSISEADVKEFCKFSHDLRIVRSSCISHEYLEKPFNSSYIGKYELICFYIVRSENQNQKRSGSEATCCCYKWYILMVLHNYVFYLFQSQIWMILIVQWNITLFFGASNDSTRSIKNIQEIWMITLNQILWSWRYLS